MKCLTYPLLVCLLSSFTGIPDLSVKLFLVPVTKGSAPYTKFLSSAANTMFEYGLIIPITNDRQFPCIGLTDSKVVSAVLGEVSLWKRPEFGSQDISRYIDNAYNTLYNSDYYLLYSIYPMKDDLTKYDEGNMGLFKADFKCSDKQGKVILKYSRTYTFEEVFGPQDGVQRTNIVIKPVQDFVRELSKHEICPYTGPVTIEIRSERDESTESTTPCVGGTIVTTSTVNSNSTLTWSLFKEELIRATGNVTYDLSEKYKTVISNPCYICNDGTKGFATITETNESEAKVEGLSNESVFEGKQVDDARVSIVFLDDGKYLLEVEATSEKGTLKKTTEKKVDGPCQNANESVPPDTKTKSIDVPLRAVFGPYKGTGEDKVLSQSETKDVSPGKEKTTIKIDFTLTRD